MHVLSGAPQVHSLPGVRAMLDPSGVGPATIKSAAQAQALRAATLELAVRHNQVRAAQAPAWRVSTQGVVPFCAPHHALFTFAGLATALQELLDFIVRKLDRRRRVLMWRSAAVEGVSGERRRAALHVMTSDPLVV